MDSNNTKFCLYSYNTRGTGANKLDFINDILTLCVGQIPIFCIQEHFLLRSNLYKLSNTFTKFSVIAKPAHKSFDVQNYGRPMGGLAMVIPREFRKYVTIFQTNS